MVNIDIPLLNPSSPQEKNTQADLASHGLNMHELQLLRFLLNTSNPKNSSNFSYHNILTEELHKAQTLLLAPQLTDH